MQEKKAIFSLTAKDFIMQTFTVGGHGGSGKDTSNTGVRFIHPPSGATGEGREERSQLANKRRAFRRMAESDKFQRWVKIEVARRMGRQQPKTEAQIRAEVDARVAEMMKPENLKVEVYSAL
jgi:protein subunit release factor A